MRSIALLAALAAGAALAQTAPTLAALTGAEEAAVKLALGVPDIARVEGQGGLWTYRFQGCALLVYFKQEGRVRRVSGASASHRRSGAALDVDQCIAQGAQAAATRNTGRDAIDALLSPTDPAR